jgi:hypothetical protein
MIATGLPPNTAISANFPSDAFAFGGSNGLALDSDSLNSFVAFFGNVVDATTLLDLVVYTLQDTAGNSRSFNAMEEIVFQAGASIQIASYECVVSLGP